MRDSWNDDDDDDDDDDDAWKGAQEDCPPPCGNPSVTIAIVSLNGLAASVADADTLRNMKQEIIAEWERAWRGEPPFPLLVLPPGCTFQLVMD